MDANLKAQWLTALRSGEYQQGQGTLSKDIDGEMQYCCLGVLCDIVDPDGWAGDCWTTPEEMVVIHGNDDYLETKSSHLLPEFLASAVFGENEYGFANQNGETGIKDRGGMSQALTSLNDSGFTFSEIADVIENKF